MKPVSVMLLGTAGLAGLAWATPPDSEPTALEALARKPSAEIRFSRELGAVESTDASVGVTALVVEDAADRSVQGTGVRLVLQDNSGTDQVWLDEVQLAALKRDLSDIQGGIPSLEAGRDAPYRVQGTGSCWDPPRPVRILCPSYRVGPDWSGMTLGAYLGPVFEFPGRTPSELAKLVDDALAALAAR